MKRLNLLILLASVCLLNIGWTFAGGWESDAGGGAEIVFDTVANLPATPTAGDIAGVNDGDNAADCTVGSGSNFNICVYDGANWVIVGDGTTGSGLTNPLESNLLAAGYDIVNVGNLGIGTTAPTVELDVVGDVNVSGTLTVPTISNVNTLTFDTAPVIPTYAEGNMYWDETDKTLVIQQGVDDVALQVGQEMYIRVRNATGSTITDGQVVYISSQTGNRPNVILAKADSTTTSEFIGIATHDIEDNSDGLIAVFGNVRGIDTSAFSAGDDLYLSAATAGALTATPPASPNLVIKVGRVLVSNVATGEILVTPTVFNEGTLSADDLRLVGDLEVGGDVTVDGTITGNLTGNVTGTASGNLTTANIDTYSELNTIVADQTLAYGGGAFHDGFSDFVDNEHIDWTTDQGATNIHAGNYTDTNTTYTASGTLLDLTDTTFSIPAGTLTNTKYCTYVTGTGIVCNSEGGGAVEGTAVLSTGETGGSKFLREDGDGTSSWQSIPGGGDALTASPLSQFAATSSSQLAGVISDETGSGVLVFGTSPTFTTGILVNGTGKFTGNVGIGTTNPSGRLDIEGGDVFIGTGTLTNTSASEDLSVTGNLEVDGVIYGAGTGLTGTGASFTAGNSSATASDSTWTSHNNYPSACSAGQYVSGLGDTLTCGTPTDTNTTYSGGTNLTLDGTTFNVDDAFLINSGNDTTTGTVTAAGFTTTGTGTFGALTVESNTVDFGDVTEDYVLTFNASTNTWAGEEATGGSSQWTTTGSDIYYSTGNVGIGTSVPAYDLEVDGDISADGTIYGTGIDITSATGNSFQVLDTDDNIDFIVLSTGFVGIGTSVPTAGLSVQGKGIVPSKVTADPCGSGYPEGSIFWNDTANELCVCDGTNDLRVKDMSTACF
jgi:hypothetical protein